MASKKRGQMEILGITVVIVFIALGILFIVKFNILKDPSSTKKAYIQSELTYNAISALLKATSKDCKERDMESIILDCIENNAELGSICKKTFDAAGNEIENRTCEYFRYTASDILNRTFVSWERAFAFDVTAESGGITNNYYSKGLGLCSGEKKTGVFQYRASSKDVTIRLDICS